MNKTVYKFLAVVKNTSKVVAFYTQVLFVSLFFSAVQANEVSQSQSESKPSQKLMPVNVQINWNHQFQFAGFYAALKEGYYQKVGLDVSIKVWRPGVDVVDEVVSGRSAFGVTYNTAVINYLKGAPIKLLMSSFQFSPLVLVSREPITALSQLSGKKIMHFNSLQVKVLLNRAESEVKKPIIEVPSSGNLQDFIDRKVDLYAAYKTNEIFRLQEQNFPFYELDPKSFGIHSYGDLVIVGKQFAMHNPDVVQRFKEATIKGWEYAINNQASTVDYILQNYPVVKSRKALINEAKATFDFVKSGDIPIGDVSLVKLAYALENAKEVGVLDKKTIEDKPLDEFLVESKNYQLTKEELEYVQKNPTIKVGNDFNASPFEFINEDGQFDGISADYFRWFAKEHGFNFVALKNTQWAEVLEKAEKGELDILPRAVETPSRKQYLNFTKPYLEFPMVLMARENVSYVASLSRLNNKKVAVGKGWFTEELLKNNYPEIQLVSVHGLKEGLISVLEGKADYYYGNLAAINYMLKKERLTGLKVVATTNEKMVFTMGVNKDNPVLFSILQKTLNVMPEDEKNRIYNKWIQLTVENANYDKYIFIASLIFGLLLATIIWLYITNRARNKLQAYIDKVNELRLATVLDKNGVITWVSKRYCALTGYEQEELRGKPYSLFKPDTITNEDYEKRFKHVRSGKIWEGEVEGRTKNGETFYVKASIIPEMKGDSIQRITIYREDLSDKKRIEALSIKDE
ncbi:MAG: transporter substrate-binding domain-containing protein, partial [Pseudomonadota bacterium]|nr:transporter substrate-binding domain-containing protein [Pseudomonadota bacterium]